MQMGPFLWWEEGNKLRMLSMSTYNMNTMMTTREMIGSFLALPFQAVVKFFTTIQSSRMEQLDALNAMSDEDLAARGLTRAQAAQAILRCGF